MSRESDEWASQRSAGTLDDPIYPDWVVPNCCKCNHRAHYAIKPNGYVAVGSLENPPYDGATFYCSDHYPEKNKK